MDEFPITTQEIKEDPISENFYIKLQDIKYKLNIYSNEQKLLLNLSEENIFFEQYQKKLMLDEIKKINHIFSKFSSCRELFDYIKSEIKNDKLEINRKDINIILFKLKKDNILFKLTKKKLKDNVIIMNLCNEIVNIKKNLNTLVDAILLLPHTERGPKFEGGKATSK